MQQPRRFRPQGAGHRVLGGRHLAGDGPGGSPRGHPGDDALLTAGRRAADRPEGGGEAWEEAVAFLAQRPRSCAEVRRRLQRRRVPPDEIAAVLDRLTAAGYLDDAAFAATWARSRQARQKLGPARLTRELKGKGIADGEIAAALEALRQERDLSEVAAEAAARRLKGLQGLSPEVGRRRLAGYLERRGFPAELILRLCREHFPRDTD